MTFEQCHGNLNYMHEYRIDNNWYPCHLYDLKATDNRIYVFTRNGTITSEKITDVRKMSKEGYIKQRANYESILGEYFTENGYHDTLEEDLKLWEVA